MTAPDPALERWLRDQLLDVVPMAIAVVDREFEVVYANGEFERLFGPWRSRKCFAVYKRRDTPCQHCRAVDAFRDGLRHVGEELGVNHRGEPTHYIKHTIPVVVEEGAMPYVLELSTDISDVERLREELESAHSFVQTVMAASPDGIVALGAAGEVTVFNRAARELVRASESRTLDSTDVTAMLPEGLLTQVAAGPGQVTLPDSEVRALDGEHVPARLVGVRLGTAQRPLGTAVFVQDLRALKQLEKEKLDAERLAAVGQTVAGLAHGIKNLITSLEGGMYLLETGLKKSQPTRIEQGWDMLSRNVERISVFVRNFLSFSRGRRVTAEPTPPAAVAREVVELYRPKAETAGIELRLVEPRPVPEAPMDREAIHECLTNLVGNAIDACQMSEAGAGKLVEVRCIERDGAVVFEVVDDGCGMDYEVKRKLFTTFFTTKGLGGTGLGLLMTRKIVQEHGGRVSVDSEVGRGTTFRIILPRQALGRLAVEAG